MIYDVDITNCFALGILILFPIILFILNISDKIISSCKACVVDNYCRNGNLKDKYKVMNTNNLPIFDKIRIFERSCAIGDIELVKYITEVIGGYVLFPTKRGFVIAAENGHIELVKYMRNFNIPYEDIFKAFSMACMNNHLDVAMFLQRENVFTDSKIIEVFHSLCKNADNIDTIKWIYTLCYYDPSTLEKALSISLDSENSKLIKWLYDLDISVTIKNKIFISTCESGHTKIAKWIHSKGNLSESIVKDAFLNSCENEQIVVAKWFIDVYPDILFMNLFDICPQMLFKIGIAYNSIDLIESIKQNIVPENVNKIDNIIVRALMFNENTEMLKKLALQ